MLKLTNIRYRPTVLPAHTVIIPYTISTNDN